jgi:hypothetical protein
MAILAVNEHSFPFTKCGVVPATSFTVTNQTLVALDGANDAFAWVGDPPISGSLTTFYFRTGTTSSTSGPLNFDGRVEQLTNLRPNGTLHAANTNGAVSVADSDDNVWKECTLTSAATVTRGTPIGIRIQAPASGTFSMILSSLATNAGFLPGCANFPVAATDGNGDGTFDATVTASSPCLVLLIDGALYAPTGCIPYDTWASANFSSSSNPNEKALRIYSAVSRRIIGMRAYVGNVTAGADFTFSLWPDSASSQADGDALAQVSTDGDGVVGTTIDGWVERSFSSPVTIAADTAYWAGVRADTANNAACLVATLPTLGGTVATQATPGGTQMYYGSRQWSAGSAPAFTPDTAAFIFIELICDGIDVGSSGGGLLRHPGMSGGLSA